MINQPIVNALLIKAEKKLSAYRDALKKGELELACDYLIASAKLKIAIVYIVDTSDITNKAIAYREAARLAYITDDYHSANQFLYKGLNVSRFQKNISDSIRILQNDVPKPEPLLKSILIRKRCEEERKKFKIGDVLLLNDKFFFTSNTNRPETVKVDFDYAVCISQAFEYFEMQKYTFYLIYSKKFISESCAFMRSQCIDVKWLLS